LINGQPFTVTVRLGAQVTVTISGFMANEAVQLTLHSVPMSLGTYHADASGNLTASVTIPADAALGAHELSATGLASGRSGAANLIAVAADGGAAPSAPARGGPLAATGGPVVALTAAGLLLVLVGAGYVGLARRRRRG
jgi:LPXTG-motif cell wall-anchored protein